MAITEASLETNFNTYVGDASTDRISAAERLQFATEATVWLSEELGNDHQIATYSLSYYDSVHYYKVTTAIATLLEGADLRRGEFDQGDSFTHKSSRELAGENNYPEESAWAIERRDSDWYLVVSHDSKYPLKQISSFESLTSEGGTWEADTTTSDATNLTIDSAEYKEGSGCFNFDIDVSQSGNNRATISIDDATSMDLSDLEDLGAFFFRAYLPTVTNFTSFTLYWGTDTSNYWSATVTTDYTGSTPVAEWNRFKVNWSAATMTGTPDASDITYFRFDLNYGAGQGDDTDYRLDDFMIVRPEVLTFFYTSWIVGVNNSGTNITAFTATTDVPFFSGKYDQYKFAVSHKMASLAFYGPLRNQANGAVHEAEALKALQRVRRLFPSSVTKEEKSFKVRGLNFRRRRR